MIDLDKPRKRVVYLLTNSVTGKKYVGSTTNLAGRIRQHRHDSSGCFALRNAVCKYGWEVFRVEILSEFDNDKDAMDEETRQIVAHDCLSPQGYNLSPTASGTSGYKWRPESRAKAGRHTVGRKQRPEHIAKRVAKKIGVPLSSEHRQKLSELKRGRKQSPEHARAGALSRRGKPRAGIRIRINGVSFSSMKAAGDFLGISKGLVWLRIEKKVPGYERIGAKRICQRSI